MLRKATALDWAGDPLEEVQERFIPLHGERNFEEMLAHFKDYTDVVGDHPQNMVATALGINAYALTGEDQYKSWVLDYVEAWRQRTLDNDDYPDQYRSRWDDRRCMRRQVVWWLLRLGIYG